MKRLSLRTPKAPDPNDSFQAGLAFRGAGFFVPPRLGEAGFTKI